MIEVTRRHYWDDGLTTHQCEICEAPFSQADEATLPETVEDDGREGRFCPTCRCDLIEAWPSEGLGELEWRQISDWRATQSLGHVELTTPIESERRPVGDCYGYSTTDKN